MKSKLKKKLLIGVSLMGVLALVAASCNHNDNNSGSEGATVATTALTSAKVGLIYDIGGRGDQSFNDSAFTGANRAKSQLGITFNEVSPNPDGTNRAQLIDLQAENQDLVIGVGFLFDESILAAAKENPNVRFAIVDSGAVEGSPSNLANLVFAEHEGSFLVGVAAGLKTKTDKVGFIGGVKIPLIQKFEAGFVAGVKAANKNAVVDVKYITDPPVFEGFNAPAKARVIADKMYSGGNDIIYHAAGGSGAGLFEAAKAASTSTAKVWAIGVDSDQYNAVDGAQREFILTSMLKRVDNAVFNIIKEFKGGNTTYDLSTDGVGYSTSGGFVDDIKSQLESFKQKIIDGEIVVPSSP